MRSRLGVAAIALAGCVSGGAIAPAPLAPLPGAGAIAFTLPRAGAPFDLTAAPWPSELARRPGGRLDLRAFPARDTAFFAPYVAAAERDVEGFPLAPAITFRFTGVATTPRLSRDPSSLAAATAPVFLVDVDPSSPERGRFVPIEHRFYEGDLRLVPPRTLAVKPAPGIVLRAATLYAAVVRREIGGAGAELGTPIDLEVIKSTRPRADPDEERARALHAGAFDLLQTLGVPRDRVASIALFRTHAPHLVTARLPEVIARLPPDRAPRFVDARRVPDRKHAQRYRTIAGTYCTPSFQDEIDEAPFLSGEGGRFVLDARGAPEVVPVPPRSAYRVEACGDLLLARFVLTVPEGEAPARGFPLMVSAHGTGGDAASFLGEDDFAGWAARRGIAVVSTDQPLHGGAGPAPRPGALTPLSVVVAGLSIPISDDPRAAELAFYNALHPAAARDNLRQAAADVMVLARLFTSGALAAVLPPGEPLPRFDRARVLAAGHSQGSQSVAAVGAVDPLIRAVVLSGCGGDARLGVLRRRDLPIVPAITALLGVAPGELDELHPILTLMQALADPIDPASYARLYWEPLPGRRAPSVLHVEGLGDTFTPNVTAEALAVALRAAPVTPLAAPVRGLDATSSMDAVMRGEAARAFAQIAPTRGENGHFVIYHEAAAAELIGRFLGAAIARP